MPLTFARYKPSPPAVRPIVGSQSHSECEWAGSGGGGEEGAGGVGGAECGAGVLWSGLFAGDCTQGKEDFCISLWPD